MMPLDSSELLKARDRLLAGDVVAIPTETVYGLAASIESEAGLRRIFSLKERPFFDPLIVHVSSLKEAATLVREWPPLADFLGRFFWPGPLTLVLPKSDRVNPLITSGLETVAVRYPAHPVALDLIRLTGVPLAAPSANKFGKTSPSRSEHVQSEFPETDLVIIDGGECEVGLESTVLGFGKTTQGDDQDYNEIQILRPGGVTEDMLRDALKKWGHPVEIRRISSEASPGHLKHHYMPSVPLVILPGDPGKALSATEIMKLREELKIAGLQRPAELLLSQDATLAARELYSEMRRLADSGADLLFVRRSSESEHGLWPAIWDRLTRAATLNWTQRD
jgi:L-threonylcarbamoyladenylate synthase